MRNLIAFFNNRSGAMQFASELKKMGVRCKTINTPREISASCGISVMFEEVNLNQVRFILARRKFAGFVKLYREITSGGFKKYISI